MVPGSSCRDGDASILPCNLQDEALELRVAPSSLVDSREERLLAADDSIQATIDLTLRLGLRSRDVSSRGGRPEPRRPRL